ncbi:helix-turn-helix transcriptional regulator [Microbulbifer litoralis]|uniref:helix-turn-helix transcriptional regulator n=1 Tax=Microbulbifer litoralis TaxID=2933965 RepID=UPI0020285699|nr:response regulator transcription factor [Microbulbifer sp. GX H0434]
MPILFFSGSGLQGELLYSLVSDALPFNWEKSEIGKQKNCLQNYRAIVIDCWHLATNGEAGNILDLLRKLNHPRILLINYPAESSIRLGQQLKGNNTLLLCDASTDRESLIRKLGTALQNSDHPPPNETRGQLLLTPREQEILTQLTTGEPNSVIASKLHLSEHTVKNHMYNIFRKIGVKNRLQASNWAKLHLQAEKI